MGNGNFIGAIVGDIVGSVYEFDNYRAKDFELFGDWHGGKCFATDDSIMTLGVAKALIEYDKGHGELDKLAIRYMREIGQPYRYCGYGGQFLKWMYSDTTDPYYSFGNGAAMRVSAVAYTAEDILDVISRSRLVTAVTHNHPEGIKGAEATAVATWSALQGNDKDFIKRVVQELYYDLNFTLDQIRPTYLFNETCQDTVPQAIVAFLESESFEDAIRNAVSVGGDSDTLAAITGSIAGAYYGVPEEIEKKARSFLDPNLEAILDEFKEKYNS